MSQFDDLVSQSNTGGGAFADLIPKSNTPTPQAPQPGFNPLNDLTGQGGQQKSTGILSSLFQSTVGSKGLAGSAQLPGKTAAAISEYAPGVGQHSAEKLNDEATNYGNQALQLLNKAKTETDPTKKALLMNQAKEQMKSAHDLMDSAGNISNQTDTTGKQALGTTANSALTVGTAGTDSVLGNAGLKVAKPLVAGTSDIVKGTKYIRAGAQAVENAGIGAGFQGASNLQEGKNLTDNMGKAALFGAAIPLGTKAAAGIKNGIQKTAELSSEGIINRIIKPGMKDLGYGHEPARGILNEGITANSLSDLKSKVQNQTQVIGQGIGTLGEKVQLKLGNSLDLTPALTPLDVAMNKAAKSNNPTLLTNLNNVKVALTHDLQMVTDAAGTPGIATGEPRALNQVGYADAVKFMKDMGEHVKWTGSPSDDKLLNVALQDSQRSLRDIMNKAAAKADPALGRQILDLNKRYGDLLSAGNAISHREVIANRNNVFDLGTKIIGGGSAIFTVAKAVATGNYAEAGKELLVEAAGTGLLKGLGSTAVQTRVAKFLDALGPVERQGILNSTPGLQNIYQRLTGNAKPLADAPKTTALEQAEALPYSVGQTLGISPESMDKLKTYMSLGKGAADRAGVGEDFQKVMDYVHSIPNKEGGFAAVPGAKSDALIDKVTTELQNLDTHPLTVNGRPDLSDADTQFRAMQLQKKAAEGKITAADAKEGADLLKSYGIDVNASGDTVPQKLQPLKNTEAGYVPMSQFGNELKRNSNIPKELEPLAKEARKYKSAEEFVKGGIFSEARDSGSRGIIRSELKSQTKLRNINDIKPNPSNPILDKSTVKIKLEDIQAGKRPYVLVDEKGQLIDGHHAYEAYKQAGIKEIPVINKSQLTDFYNKVNK